MSCQLKVKSPPAPHYERGGERERDGLRVRSWLMRVKRKYGHGSPDRLVNKEAHLVRMNSCLRRFGITALCT